MRIEELLMLRRVSWCLLMLVVLAGTSEADEKPSRILFVTQSMGFKHGSVNRPADKLAPAEVALIQLGEQSKLFNVHCAQDCEADFTKENLQNYDIVAFYTTGDLPIAEADREYFFKEWILQKGHGVLGFHSAGDTYHDYEPYWDLMGGVFIGHPWGAGTKIVLTNHEPENPLVKSFGKEFHYQDEIYMYRNWQPEKVHVLLSLDYSQSPIGNGEVIVDFGYHVPVCWIKQVGEGKLYYNNLGHREESWTNPEYLESITQAVRWMRGEFEVNAAPNPEVSAAQEAKSKADFAAGGFKAKAQ